MAHKHGYLCAILASYEHLFDDVIIRVMGNLHRCPVEQLWLQGRHICNQCAPCQHFQCVNEMQWPAYVRSSVSTSYNLENEADRYIASEASGLCIHRPPPRRSKDGQLRCYTYSNSDVLHLVFRAGT